MRRTRLWGALVVIGLITSGCGPADGIVGPDTTLEIPGEYGWMIDRPSGAVLVGETQLVAEHGAEQNEPRLMDGVVIEEIEATWLTEGVDQIGAWMGDIEAGRGLYGDMPYPIDPDHMASLGFTSWTPVGDEPVTLSVGPDDGFPQMLIAYEADRPGRYVRKEIVVTYRRGARSETAVLPARGLLCIDVQPCDWTDEHQAMVE